MAAVLGVAVGASAAQAEEKPRLLRIGTAGAKGAYNTIGTAMATILTERISGLLAVAQTSNGSVANVEDIRAGMLEAAFTQADVAFFASRGKGMFKDKAPLENLRLVGRLYPESLHVLATKASGAHAIAELRGMRMSLDEPGSGTLPMSVAALAANGLKESDIKAEYLKPDFAGERIRAGALDALSLVTAWPAPTLMPIFETGMVILLPIQSAAAEAMIQTRPFLARSVIPAGTYPSNPNAVETIDIPSQFVVSASLPDDLVQEITRVIYAPDTLERLRRIHPRATSIDPARALDGAGIPLHPGAERYWRETGLLH